MRLTRGWPLVIGFHDDIEPQVTHHPIDGDFFIRWICACSTLQILLEQHQGFNERLMHRIVGAKLQRVQLTV